MNKLRIRDHQGAVSTIELRPGDRVSIGRADSNQLVLTDPSLSRAHAEMFHEDGRWMIQDAGSRNGTYVSGRRIDAPVALEPGMTAIVGASELSIESEGSAAAAAAAAGGNVKFADRPLVPQGTVMMSAEQVMAAPRPARVDERGYAEGLDKIRKRFDIVEKANLALQAHESMDVLLPKILDLVLEAVRPERAALVQRNEDGLLICKAYRGKGEQMTISRTIADTVIDKRVSVLTSDAQTDERFAAGASIVAQGIQAVMGVPLWNNKEVIGLIYADSTLASGLFDDEDLRLLTMLANVAAIQIENASLFSEQLEKQRFEREAKAAADIQKRLLPRTKPIIEGYAFESYNEACYECGGDYFDCLPLGEGRTGVVLADVAGKGMGAAMLMAVIQATLQARAGTGTAADALAQQLGAAIARSAPSNRYATLFLMDLNHATNTVSYVNAGHAPSPFLVRADGETRELKPGGTPLGLFPDATYPVIDLELHPGDLIFACSDGVTDLENPDEEMFGEERLERFLRERAGRPIAEIQRELDAEMERFAKGTPQPDDLTYVILQRSV